MSLPYLNRTFAGLALTALFVGGALLLLLAHPRWREELREELLGRERLLLGLALLVAGTAMGGSLYYSEGIGFIPCSLCWYQRIAMYPLVPLFGVALLRRDMEVWRYTLPLSLIGLAISIYHLHLEFNPGAPSAFCSGGVPCSARYVAVMGFISIPFMAGSAFVLLAALALTVRATSSGEGTPE